MTSSRRVAGLFTLCILTHAAGCTMYLARVEIEEQQTLDFTGVKHVQVDTRNGSIDVKCDPAQADADIRVVKYANGTSEADAREQAEQIEIAADRDPQQADTLRVAAKWPESAGGRNRGAKFSIALPPHATLDLKTRNGGVSVARAAAGADIDTSNGSITVLDTRGHVAARTSNGRITLTGIDGDVNAHSSNGTIRLDRVGASSVAAVTSNGGIHAANVKGNVNAKTSNGSIELRIAAMPDKPEIKVVSSNGRVLVEAPGSVNAKLRMRTSNGRVSAKLDDVGNMRDFESGRQHLSATLNKGEGLIEIQSSNGGVTFETRSTSPTGTSGTPVALAR